MAHTRNRATGLVLRRIAKVTDATSTRRARRPYRHQSGAAFANDPAASRASVEMIGNDRRAQAWQ